MNKEIISVSPEAMDVLTKYQWPGNVRELKNIVERAVLLETSDTLTTDYLPGHLMASDESGIAENDEDLRTLEEVSKLYIREVLEKAGGRDSRH